MMLVLALPIRKETMKRYTIKFVFSDNPKMWSLLAGGHCSEVALCYKNCKSVINLVALMFKSGR